MSLSERLAARGADLTGITDSSLKAHITQNPTKRSRQTTSQQPKRTITAALVPLNEDLSNWSLTRLKELAITENMDEGWQDIGKEHRGELVDSLNAVRQEAHDFLAAVCGSESKIRQDAASVTMTEARGKWKGTKAEQVVLSQVFPAAVAACVHVGIHGSGVIVPAPEELDATWVLTNAHCVDHDNDEQDEDAEQVLPERIGRYKSIFHPDGTVQAAQCVACCNDADLAILQLNQPAEVKPAMLSPDSPREGTTVVCVGNPGDERFRRFYMSCGVIKSVAADRRRNPDLGATKHSCWTYWGHSGAPLFNTRGEIVALHNSWNDITAARHAVSHQEIVKFLQHFQDRILSRASCKHPKKKLKARQK